MTKTWFLFIPEVLFDTEGQHVLPALKSLILSLFVTCRVFFFSFQTKYQIQQKIQVQLQISGKF